MRKPIKKINKMGHVGVIIVRIMKVTMVMSTFIILTALQSIHSYPDDITVISIILNYLTV